MNPFIDTSTNAPQELVMSVDEYVSAMEVLFEEWLQDQTCNITVDPFTRMIRDNYIGRSSLCSRSSCMRNWLCLNANGQLSPCDRYFPDEFCYGFVNDLTDIRQVYSSAGYMNLMSKAIIRRHKCQQECDVYSLCEGGCNNNALFEGGIDQNGGFSCQVTKALLHMVKKAAVHYDLYGEHPQVKNPVLLHCLGELRKESNA